MFNSHFFKILTSFIVMIMIGIALLFVSGEGNKNSTGRTEQSQISAED